jgi:hypothetical protein
VAVTMIPARPGGTEPRSRRTGPQPGEGAPEVHDAPLWTVTVDHGGEPLDDDFDARGLDALVQHLGRQVAAVSHRPRRFTTTVRLHDTDALAAANQAAQLVGGAARAVGLPAWPLVHIEVERRT